MTIEAVIFDFDGLLMDTEGTMVASWQYEWRQHGLELDLAAFLADHGGDLTQERYGDLARAVGPGYDRPASHARRMAYRNTLNSQLGLLPGIGAWLDEAVETRPPAGGRQQLAPQLGCAGCWTGRDTGTGSRRLPAATRSRRRSRTRPCTCSR